MIRFLGIIKNLSGHSVENELLVVLGWGLQPQKQGDPIGYFNSGISKS